MPDIPGLLFAVADTDPADETEWNRWYDRRHVPQREALPGFLNARRFELVEGEGAGKYAALYDLASPAAIQSPEYRALWEPPIVSAEDTAMMARFVNLRRAVMEQIAQAGSDTPLAREKVGGLLLVALQPEREYEDEFNDWYSTEHIVYGARVEGMLRVRRFRAVEGEPPYLAVWELADLNVTKQPMWRQALDTPWRERIRRHYVRTLYGLYRPR